MKLETYRLDYLLGRRPKVKMPKLKPGRPIKSPTLEDYEKTGSVLSNVEELRNE